MSAFRQRRLDQEDGFTLIELLVAMSIAVVLLGVVLETLNRASLEQQDVEHRTETLTDAQLGMEHMTRELRQATWLYFRSSAVVDLNVRVRESATSTGEYRLVRYDCSGDTCDRLEGPPVVYPPGVAPTFTMRRTVVGAPSTEFGNRIGQVIGHDVFQPLQVDTDTGAATPNYLEPDYVRVRLRLATPQHDPAMELQDGVSLRNRTTFQP